MMKKMIHSTLFAAALLTASHASADDPQPYTNIRNVTYVPYFLENGYLLNNMINLTSGSVFIDVGSRDGAAARYVAQNTQGVTIYAVNAWWSCDPSQKNLFQKFLSNVKQENTTASIIPLRMASSEAARAINVIGDVIYLGSSNQNLSVDILAWFAHLSSSGIICGNDWDDSFVETNVSQAATKLGSQVNSNGTFWYIQKGS
jgi:hypothetical protein